MPDSSDQMLVFRDAADLMQILIGAAERAAWNAEKTLSVVMAAEPGLAWLDLPRFLLEDEMFNAICLGSDGRVEAVRTDGKQTRGLRHYSARSVGEVYRMVHARCDELGIERPDMGVYRAAMFEIHGICQNGYTDEDVRNMVQSFQKLRSHAWNCLGAAEQRSILKAYGNHPTPAWLIGSTGPVMCWGAWDSFGPKGDSDWHIRIEGELLQMDGEVSSWLIGGEPHMGSSPVPDPKSWFVVSRPDVPLRVLSHDAAPGTIGFVDLDGANVFVKRVEEPLADGEQG